MTDLKPDDLIDVAIKGVRLRHQASDGIFSIWDEHERAYPMPPQAAITRPSEVIDDRITAVLDYLDGLEGEECIQPYVAARVREVAGLPPRNWPPQPGDIWNDGYPSPFFSPLWFAQRHCTASPDDPNRTQFQLLMVPVEGGPKGAPAQTPEELRASAIQLTLVYRPKDGGQ